MMTGLEMTPALFAEAATYLSEHPEATALTLEDLGMVAEAPAQQILASPIDSDRLDLVDEFRRKPLGPYSEELRVLLWHLRAQHPAGRYVLEQLGESHWRVLHLVGGTRPRVELVTGPLIESFEDAEWEIFRLRWRDHTGRVLPATRSVT